MNAPSLPPLSGLTPQSSTKELLGVLTDQYLAKDTWFAASRRALDAWATEFAVGDGSRSTVELVSRHRDISIAEFFQGMDRAQAGRFLGELFNDIIPHLSSQQAHIQGLASGRTAAGAPVKRSGFLARVASVLKEMSDDGLAPHTEVLVRDLTWKDDGLSGVESRASVEVSVNDQSSPGRRPKL